ncbi:MAG: ABC transporter permease, partial [Clostridiales bacterium]|nr:ABC transporter permease [Clostridiales bacterium]
MKTLYIAYYTALRNMRDYRNMTTMLALPIVLILILGSALAGTFQIESIDPVKVVLVNENEGDLLQNLKQFLQQKSIKEIVDTETVEYLDQGMEKIKSGEAFALIYLEGSNGGKIHVYKRNESMFRGSVVQNVLDSFVQSANA